MSIRPALSTGNTQMTGLLHLPLELRNEIYRNLIPTKCIIEVSSPRFKYKISNEGARLNTAGSDTEKNVSDTIKPPLKSGEPALSDIGPLDNGLTRTVEVSVPEFGQSKYRPPKDTYKKNLADFNGYSRSAYEINLEDVTTSCGKNKNSIFLVSKQISDEALEVMYGENAFWHYFHLGGDICLKNIPDATWSRIRMLLLTAEHRKWIGEITPDIALWASIIPKLKNLRLVMEQPGKQTGWTRWSPHPDRQTEMKDWVLFVRAFLSCFNRLLGGRPLEVDFNGKWETGEVVKECILGGYRDVRCGIFGDIIFWTGRS